MFRGVTNINLDAKGRLAIPARHRDHLMQHCNGEMVVTIDTDEPCLLIYPKPEWEDVQRSLDKLPSLDKAVRRIQRLLIGHATDIQLDGSGRLQLTPPLREYAQLEKKTVMLGQPNKLELWAEDQWISRRDTWIAEDTPEILSAALENFSL